MHRQGGFAIDLRDVARDLRVDIDRGERSRIDGLRGRIRLEADRTNLDIDAPWLDSDSRIEIDRGHVELSVPKGQQLTVRTESRAVAGFTRTFRFSGCQPSRISPKDISTEAAPSSLWNWAARPLTFGDAGIDPGRRRTDRRACWLRQR